MEKMTYSVALTTAISFLTANDFDKETIDKLMGLRESVEKRNARHTKGEHKPTKVQRENEDIKVQIAELLTSPMTATEVANAIGQTPQKATALLKQMVTAGVVVRNEGKGKTKPTYAKVVA